MLVGGKYGDLLRRKKTNIRGKRWKNGEKGEMFTVLGKRNIILEKGRDKQI